MPVWSVTDEVLYYRRDGSVWRWTPSDGEQLFLEGVGWQFPTMSPDGRYLAYVVPQDDGSHSAFLIDLQDGGSPALIGEQRTMPVFLTATQLWFKSEHGAGCVFQEEEELIYDINESAESRSIIDSVRGVWPATSSNA
jgi:Tol biopolymer transport system component